MQQTGLDNRTKWRPKGDRRRVEAVVETLATSRGEGESLAEVAHDARNMVTALGLYCDLLEEPGVLAAPFAHYGNELRLVAAASRRLVEKLVALDAHALAQTPISQRFSMDVASNGQMDAKLAAACNRRGRASRGAPNRNPKASPALGSAAGGPVANLAAELLANRNLLSAMAGPPIALTMEAAGGGACRCG